ncbi:MAG: tyrosine-type recombinase/integrase [Bdellovibrionota bacterium]
MEARIGLRTVAALEPGEKPYQVHDTDIHGFLIRVQPTGVMTYYYEYRLPCGIRNRIRIEKHGKITPEQARDRAKNIAADLVKGIDPKAAKRQAKMLSLRVYVETIYRPWAESHLKSGAVSVKRIKYRFAHLLDRPLDDPRLPWLLEKWKTDRLKDDVTKLTINRDLTVLKGAFSHAVKQKELTCLAVNPLSSVKLFKLNQEETERIRYLNQQDHGEEGRLFEAIDAREDRIRAGRARGNEWRSERGYELYPSLEEMIFVNCLKPMVEVSLHTGVRRGELFRLRWSDINWDLSVPVLTLRGSITKNSRTRSVPLNQRAVEVLRAWGKDRIEHGALIFPGKNGQPFNTLKTAWNKILEDAKIVDFRWHDLRHTFASRLVMRGVDLNTVRDLLGHQDLKMTLRYAHLSPSVKAEAVAKLVGPLGEGKGLSFSVR